MELGQGFSDLIYDYLVLRFRFQYYKSGERLPAIDALCSQFGVSSLTIKAALKRLQREGYISMHSGRCSTVLFRQSGGELDAFAIRFFSERRVAIPDLYQSSELVVTPMLIKGFQRMDQRDFTVLEQLAEQSNPEALLRFYCYILQKAENPLGINLFWENTLFLGLPFPMQDRGHTLYHPE